MCTRALELDGRSGPCYQASSAGPYAVMPYVNPLRVGRARPPRLGRPSPGARALATQPCLSMRVCATTVMPYDKAPQGGDGAMSQGTGVRPALNARSINSGGSLLRTCDNLHTHSRARRASPPVRDPERLRSRHGTPCWSDRGRGWHIATLSLAVALCHPRPRSHLRGSHLRSRCPAGVPLYTHAPTRCASSWRAAEASGWAPAPQVQ